MKNTRNLLRTANFISLLSKNKLVWMITYLGCLGIFFTIMTHNTYGKVQQALPLQYQIADSFGYPLDGQWTVTLDFGSFGYGPFSDRRHLGEDVLRNAGEPVYAAANGRVYHNASHTSYGNVVIIEHTLPDNTKVSTVYGHLRSAGIVNINTDVLKGDLIGYLGTYEENGGFAPHLHFGIRKEGYLTNWVYWGYDPDGAQLQFWYDPSDFISLRQSGASCPPPTLLSPGDGHTLANRIVTFSWQALTGCGSGYTFRIKDTGTMDAGGIVLADTGEGGTSRTETIPAQYENRDLYWGVKAANAANASWSVRRFRIQSASDSTPTPIPTTAPATPVPNGQVKLYSLANYGGSVVWTGNTGFSNEPNANSYALQLPSGWSAKTWRGDNRSGDDRTWCGSVANLQDYGWHLAIQSIEVYNFPCSPAGGSSTTLCTDDSATQDCTSYNPGLYQLGGTALNDQYRSVKSVLSGQSIMLYRESGFRGVADCFNGSRIPLVDGSDSNWDLRGQVTDFQVFNNANCPTSELKSLMIYRDSNASGPIAGVGVSAGIYNLSDIGGPVNRNDWASSIRVPAGKSAYVYEHNDRGGERSGCLTDTANLFGNLDRQASSVWLFDNTTCTPPAPNSPTSFLVSGSTQNSMVLVWSNVIDEIGYQVERWTGSSWFAVATVGTDTTTWTQNGLSCGTPYSFRVSAYNSTGNSASLQASGVTQACPTPTLTATFTSLSTLTPTPTPTATPLVIAPSWILVGPSCKGVYLAWRDQSVGKTEGFQLYRNGQLHITGTIAQFSQLSGEDTFYWHDMAVTLNTEYTYYVVAYGRGYFSAPSTSRTQRHYTDVSCTTPTPTTMSTPTSTTTPTPTPSPTLIAKPAIPIPVSPQPGAMIAAGNITFQWQQAEGAETYGVEIWRAGVKLHYTGPTLTGLSYIHQLAPGNYLWHVESYCSGLRCKQGWSNWSPNIVFTVTDASNNPPTATPTAVPASPTVTPTPPTVTPVPTPTPGDLPDNEPPRVYLPLVAR